MHVRLKKKRKKAQEYKHVDDRHIVSARVGDGYAIYICLTEFTSEMEGDADARRGGGRGVWVWEGDKEGGSIFQNYDMRCTQHGTR